jgi:replication factor C subunit 1
MRLRVSGGKHEIREQYMPMLASKIVSPLGKEGQVSVQPTAIIVLLSGATCAFQLMFKDALEDVIGTMDEYYLGKDDWDAFVELGVGDMNMDAVLKKIPSATKSAFTRQCVSSFKCPSSVRNTRAVGRVGKCMMLTQQQIQQV